jgi:hypothetical protein
MMCQQNADHLTVPDLKRPTEWRGRPMGPWRSQKYVNEQMAARLGLEDLTRITTSKQARHDQ